MLSIDAWLDEKPYKELYDGMVHKKYSIARQTSFAMTRVATQQPFPSHHSVT